MESSDRHPALDSPLTTRSTRRWRTARSDIVVLATAGEPRVEFRAEATRLCHGEFAVVRAGERYRIVADHYAEVIVLYGTSVGTASVETIELGEGH